MRKPRYTIYEFDDRHKRELEEWLVIDHRLREVEEALKHVHRLLGRTRKVKQAVADGGVSTRSNYCFAAVTYVRCFSAGRQRRLSINEIANLSPTNLETHTSIRELRNTFFAHAVADQESEHVYLIAPTGQKITGFSTISIVLMSDSKQGVRNFMNLVSKVRKYVIAQSERVGDAIAARHFGPGASWRELSRAEWPPIERA